MKKFISVLCFFAMICTFALGLSACKKEDEKQMRVMNVNLNPQVEFILDKDDKVVSVNALNEDGNVVINGQVFVGKTADEALQIYVNVCKETGFLVSGKVGNGDNQISISLSGEKAEEKYNSLKNSLNNYLSQENITATLTNAGALSEEYLKQKVSECMGYLSDSQINGMDYEELIANLQSSREETKDFYSQAIKENYYVVKNHAFKIAEAEYIKGELDAVSKAILDTALQVYQGLAEDIAQAREDYFIDQESDYQKALADLKQKQVDYIKYRNYVASLEESEITQIINNQLDLYENALNSAKDSLTLVYETANTALSQIESQALSAYNGLVNAISNLSVDINAIKQEIKADLEQEIDAFAQSYKVSYQVNIDVAVENIVSMKAQLTAE